MNLHEFIDFRKKCPICNDKLEINMSGVMAESFDETVISSIYAFINGLYRRGFLTFTNCNFLMIRDEDIDVDTIYKEKYETFVIGSDGYASFDYNFDFKMKLKLDVGCAGRHYTYRSRNINISSNSMDITKGYPVVSEEFIAGNYKVISFKDKGIAKIITKESANVTTVPYLGLDSFPLSDPEKTIKKIENILLLA